MIVVVGMANKNGMVIRMCGMKRTTIAAVNAELGGFECDTPCANMLLEDACEVLSTCACGLMYSECHTD